MEWWEAAHKSDWDQTNHNTVFHNHNNNNRNYCFILQMEIEVQFATCSKSRMEFFDCVMKRRLVAVI